jgi:hypothetical protein
MILMLPLVLILSATPAMAVWLMYQTNLRLLRMFSHQQGIPLVSMEAPAVEKPAAPAERPKRKISIPVPMGWTPSDMRRAESVKH